MSGTKSAIDTMTAQDSALLDSMRDDGAPVVDDAPESVDEAPVASEAMDDDHEDDGAVPDIEEGEQRPKPSKAAIRIKQLIEKTRQSEEKTRQAEEKLRTSEAVIAERLRILTEAAHAAMPPAPVAAPVPVPDVDTDPVGHFRAVAQQQARELADMKAVLSGFSEQQNQARAAAEMRAWGEAQERDFMSREPSYADATNYLLAGRHAELEAIGISDPAERQRIIQNDVTQIAAKSRQDGVNFAERIFNLASKRGFQKQAAAPVVPALDTDAPLPDRAARVENGRANSTTIAGAGSPPARTMSPDRIANMSERDFANYVAKIQGNPAALRELLGN